MRRLLFLLLCCVSVGVSGQTLRFDFTNNKVVAEGYTRVTPTTIYSDSIGYGYDLLGAPGRGEPFFFSVSVPDGNYHVTAIVGSKKVAGHTTIRGESRRLFYENIVTKRGETTECSFVINKRNTHITDSTDVRIKPRERTKLNWDDKLTLEFNGESPQLQYLVIERDDTCPTLFLCGNSTVVDQDEEPWASWGQMLPRFLSDSVAVANYAESGECASTFIAVGRLDKALSQMKAGDYILIEFGHNDQKLRGPGVGAFYSFATYIKTFIDEAMSRGAQPVLITPTCRRMFSDDGHILDTHEDYPDALRWIAQREQIPLLELNERTRTLFETLGVDGSKQAFVHYPANTFPGQTDELKDNTHFNPYGAYEIAQCVLQEWIDNHLPLTQYIRSDFTGYSPAEPDDIATFTWQSSPFIDIVKPDGN